MMHVDIKLKESKLPESTALAVKEAPQTEDPEAEEKDEPVAEDCFWHYKDVAGIDRGSTVWKVATCRPMSSIMPPKTLKELVKDYCPVCPIFIRNSSILKQAGKRIVDSSAKNAFPREEPKQVNPEDAPGYLKSQKSAPEKMGPKGLTTAQGEALIALFTYDGKSGGSFECTCGEKCHSQNAAIEHLEFSHNEVYSEVLRTISH